MSINDFYPYHYEEMERREMRDTIYAAVETNGERFVFAYRDNWRGRRRAIRTAQLYADHPDIGFEQSDVDLLQDAILRQHQTSILGLAKDSIDALLDWIKT